jgi:hypothetical protein
LKELLSLGFLKEFSLFSQRSPQEKAIQDSCCPTSDFGDYSLEGKYAVKSLTVLVVVNAM